MTCANQISPSKMKKVVLISGGTSGIGLATTKLFLSKGFKVITAARSYKKFELNFGDSNPDLRFIETDFSDMDSIRNLYSVIQNDFQSIDVAVNNVGLAIIKPLVEFEEEDFDATINVNLKSLWLSLKYQIPLMMQDKTEEKHIINISSINGLGGAENLSLYSAAKAGVISLTKSAALEYSKSNISINTIVPGPFETPMLDEALLKHANGSQEQKEAIAEQYKSLIPKGRFGDPNEIAETILWLSKGKSKFISGHSFVIDGGLSSRFR